MLVSLVGHHSCSKILFRPHLIVGHKRHCLEDHAEWQVLGVHQTQQSCTAGLSNRCRPAPDLSRCQLSH